MNLAAAVARLDRLTCTYGDASARDAFVAVRDSLAGDTAADAQAGLRRLDRLTRTYDDPSARSAFYVVRANV